MEYIVCVIFIAVVLIVLKIVFEANIKEIKKFKENKELDKMITKLPDNEALCKIFLKKLKNETVKIKRWQDETIDSSIYSVTNDTITIGNIGKSYTRLQTIAHECLHSIQPKKLLMFNFIFSNIYFIYFIAISIITAFGFVEYKLLQIFILTILGFTYFAVRMYLEQDAMTKARFLAKEYLDEIDIYKKEEKEKLIYEYDALNKIGIPMVSYTLLFNTLIKVGIYAIISVIL